MPKARIVEKKIITVPYEGENGERNAKVWLWEYLKERNLIAQTIYHHSKEIVAEVIVSTEEKEFSKNP